MSLLPPLSATPESSCGRIEGALPSLFPFPYFKPGGHLADNAVVGEFGMRRTLFVSNRPATRGFPLAGELIDTFSFPLPSLFFSTNKTCVVRLLLFLFSLSGSKDVTVTSLLFPFFLPSLLDSNNNEECSMIDSSLPSSPSPP